MAPKPMLAAAALLFSLAAIHGDGAVAVAVAAAAELPGGSARDIPAVFAFGDSTLDAGNNNGLVTAVRADHPPYGQDFPGGSPTGRFSDGKIMTDFLVEALGIKGLLPAYHSASGAGLSNADAATGVSFASGGSGLDDATATNAGVATFASQVADFSELVGRMGAAKAGEVVNKSVFLVSAGTNDMIMNYYLLPSKHTLDQYHALLIGKLQFYIQSLYNLGARRILVAGLPPVGCLPLQMTLAALRQPPRPQGCIAEQNTAAERYNAKLRKMLTKFRSTSPGAKAVYADIYTPLKDMVDHPQKYGFAETGKGCCGTGLLEMGPLCTDLMPTCATPSQFMFWDSVHPTQATYKAVADHFLRTNILHFDD
ncbi:GDSL esterase/lipase At2g40250-like [Oryza brachyantha]|uniref:GDSL esterase/lipase At2g40250-like n=1 Tax=Oryza brachyantha TaxID=4533 RepID=UPI0007760D90|nr:GDSL esterase/lipase At2g40250-like [Oryza brachyantha]